MQQYWQIKSAHQDKVLLFRMGDFFEMFHQDAEVAAPILNIALTCRNKKAADETKMCGVPHHSIAGPIAKLLAAGHKVAICDQIEDPKLAIGIVKRAVTRILSPGMVYDPDTLDQIEANYLASYDEQTVAFLDPTSGESFYYYYSAQEERERLLKLLKPVEIVLSTMQKQKWVREQLVSQLHMTAYEIPQSSTPWPHPESCERLKSYAQYMQGSDTQKTINDFIERKLQKHMELSAQTVRHLEILETYQGAQKGSLFSAVNKTKTSAGARLLKSWLLFPLTDLNSIGARQEQLEFWRLRPNELQQVRELLGQLGDVERRVGKISNPNCNARDLVALAHSLRVGLELSQFISDQQINLTSIDSVVMLLQSIEKTVVDEPPHSIKEGQMIRVGVDPQLDEFIQLSQNAAQLLQELETREKNATGISSLKVRYNNVFGYYIELTKTHANKAPSHYLRKQTLANAERFTTEELQKLEEKVLSAQARRSELELQLFGQLRQQTLDAAIDLLHLAKLWSELDVICGFAWAAIEHNYCRPQFNNNKEVRLVHSRHPVVEQMVGQKFIPNSLELISPQCLLLTGPNMAGKSTLMRQVALISLLAQSGSYVPAESANLPLFDHIFTRIGASDALTEGLSTFMVEMKESAEILRKANSQSLVILDEIGRGTSTYDGLSLAQSILEFLLVQRKSLTLFATHYHELTKLSHLHPEVKNVHMSIIEESGEIRFLHTLKEGPANKSYGIHVAQLAGLPSAVTQRARQLLRQLEDFSSATETQLHLTDIRPQENQVTHPPEVQKLVEKIKQLQVQKMTPIEALNQLAQWQQSLS